MALNFDWTKTDFSATDDNDRVTADALVWATMAIGMNEITEANARDFYARLSMWEKVVGAYRNMDGKPLFFTPEDVLRGVGLHTNASRMTKAQFYKHMWEVHERFNVPRALDTGR